MSEGLKRGARALLELIYPVRAECMGCGSKAGFERDWLCEDCRQALASRWVGAAPPPEGGLIDGAAYGYLYGGPAGGMVRNLKYRGVSRLAEPMGRQMLQAFEGLQPAHIDCVTPVPMHVRRVRKRGVNQALLLAREVADGLQLPLEEVLVRTRNTLQQARLDEAKRLHNLDGAFAVAGNVAGKRVLLVDDVCTTGATANACAKALLENGAGTVLLVCFCLAHKF
jgi:ComF family protein